MHHHGGGGPGHGPHGGGGPGHGPHGGGPPHHHGGFGPPRQVVYVPPRQVTTVTYVQQPQVTTVAYVPTPQVTPAYIPPGYPPQQPSYGALPTYQPPPASYGVQPGYQPAYGAPVAYGPQSQTPDPAVSAYVTPIYTQIAADGRIDANEVINFCQAYQVACDQTTASLNLNFNNIQKIKKLIIIKI
ncbi:MAG: hypothetical protein EZS28_010700 [Streblomastix strix]|uniref:Uncharacterized protein n=1 Tax=Streblomastix strix TaxID=222440 RepID=A0A5J4WHE0_9EUKA|nr:MAG: hypothetical protein EZS28_010700 [Streblomastix strix]